MFAAFTIKNTEQTQKSICSGGFEEGRGHGPCETSGPRVPPVILYSTTYNVGQRY